MLVLIYCNVREILLDWINKTIPDYVEIKCIRNPKTVNNTKRDARYRSNDWRL